MISRPAKPGSRAPIDVERFKLFLVCAIAVAILSLALVASAARQETDAAARVEEFEKVPVKSGDRCLVCNTPIDERNGLVILYRGRRVPLMAKMVDDFLDNTTAYFGRLQPKGALFQEESILGSAIHYGWFVFGLWVFLALIAAGLCANLAFRRGLPPGRWYFAGLAANFFGFFWMLRQKPRATVRLPPHLAKIPQTEPPVRCPKCGATNHPSAARCSSCGAAIQPKRESEVARIGAAK